MVSLVFLVLLLIIAIVVILTSAPLLRSNLSYYQEELSKLGFPKGSPDAITQQDLSERIEKSIQNLTDSYMKRERRKARKLLSEVRRFLLLKVPCFIEHGEVPPLQDRFAEDSKCKICNERSCIFY